MRGVVALTLTAFFALNSAAQAWEFSPTPICTVTDEGSDTALKLTYDGALYALHLTHPEGWGDADIFAMRFLPSGPFIQTTRHQITGNTLSVVDSGFGNVLTGLQINQIAQVILGDIKRNITLNGAEAVVEEFRRCKPDAALS